MFLKVPQLKRDSNTGVFLWTLRNFWMTPILKNICKRLLYFYENIKHASISHILQIVLQTPTLIISFVLVWVFLLIKQQSEKMTLLNIPFHADCFMSISCLSDKLQTMLYHDKWCYYLARFVKFKKIKQIVEQRDCTAL